MFIKLDDTKRTSGVQTDVEPVQALMDLGAAQESLNIAYAEYSVLTTAVENIEDGVALADAIAAKGDESTAVSVARESLRQNLKVIGQEALTSQVVAGTESISAANEGIKDVIAKAWEKTKEIVKKIWDFIMNLVSKAVQFFKGLIGKGDTTSVRLKALIKKLKDGKVTELEGAEFTDKQKEAFAEKFSILAVKDNVTPSGIVAQIGLIQEVFESVDKDAILQKVITRYLFVGDDESIDNELAKDLSDDEIIKIIESNVTSKSDKEFVPVINGKTILDLNLKPIDAKSPVATAVGEAFEDIVDAEKYEIIVAGVGFNKAHCVGAYYDEDSDDKLKDLNEAVEKFNGEKNVANGKKVLSKLSSFLRSLKVVTFTASPEKDEYEDNTKNVEPVSFDGLNEISDAMKDADKNTKTKIDKFEKAIDKKAKDVKKRIDANAKNAKKAEGVKAEVKDVISVFNTVLKDELNTQTKISKAIAQGVVDAAKSLTTGPVWDICKASADLYKKA